MTKGNRSKVPKVNIGGPKKGEIGFDEHFRYQREMIELKKQPPQVVRVNAYAKTIWVNIDKIAEEIARPTKMIIKFFAKELSVQMKQNATTKELVINGQHSLDHLEDILEKFVDTWVICDSCNKPETYIEVEKKKKVVELNCVGCRNVGPVSKLATLFDYVLKNPPKIDVNKGQFAKHIKSSGGSSQLVFLNDNVEFEEKVDHIDEVDDEDLPAEGSNGVDLVNHRDDVDHLLAALEDAGLPLDASKVPKNHVKLIKKTKKKFDLNGVELIHLVMDTYMSSVGTLVKDVSLRLSAIEPLLVKYLKRSRHRTAFFKNLTSQLQKRIQANPHQKVSQSNLMTMLRDLGPFQLDDAASDLESWLSSEFQKLA